MYVARSYTESVLSVERQMIDQRALFDNLVFSGSISIDRQMIDQTCNAAKPLVVISIKFS